MIDHRAAVSIGRGVRAGVEPSVPFDQVGELVGEKAHEVILRATLEIHHVCPHECGVVIRDGFDRRLKL